MATFLASIVAEADSGRPCGSDTSDRTFSVYRQVLLSYPRIWQLSWELYCIQNLSLSGLYRVNFSTVVEFIFFFIAKPEVAKVQLINRPYTF